jgi:hypothetical protein
MSKRKFSINDSIKGIYPFIKGVNENAECTLRNAKFCIAHDGGWSDVVNHMKTKKKNINWLFKTKLPVNSISNYLSKNNIIEMEKQLSLAVQEATFGLIFVCLNFSMFNI